MGIYGYVIIAAIKSAHNLMWRHLGVVAIKLLQLNEIFVLLICKKTIKSV